MHVLIAGAGLGGLMLAALLEKAGVSYQVFEKAHEIKPLGSAMSLGAHIFPVLKQLGIYDEFMRNALPGKRSKMCSYPDGKEWVDDFGFFKERYGEYCHIIDRPKLYEILGRLVPKGNIHYGKKVQSIEQNVEGVMIRCNDNTTYHGDILVGADGAYSAVRQALYKQLKNKGLLPKGDDVEPPFNNLCLVGVTRPLPPGTFEAQDGCRIESMFYKNRPYFTVLFSNKDGGVKWMVLEHIGDYRTREDERFRNSEWGTEGALGMAERVRDLATPFGRNLGFYIDNTPKENMSKVMLEEKFYKTWHYGRTVLLGDACHKFYPVAGQGAINAMMDAVVLANTLHACPTTTIDDVRRFLNAYKNERFSAAKMAFDASAKLSYIGKRSFMGDIVRFIVNDLAPRKLVISAFDDMYTYRPQASFLPFFPPEGTFKPAPQTNYDHLKKSVSTVVL